VQTVETEWDEREQGYMLALALYRDQCCPAGHWLVDSGAPENEGRYEGRALRCHACTAAGRKAETHKDSPQPMALLMGAELKPRG
jgi:hypothetical protein